jgi:hypothetical protein
MARMILPERGIDFVTGAFESVLPDGIYLMLRGRQVSVRSVDLPPLSEFHAGGVFPFRWLSETSRARVHIGDLCEQIAGSISGALAGWRSSEPAAWPWPGAKVRVDSHDYDVQVTFAGADEHKTMRLGEIRWEGPCACDHLTWPRFGRRSA